MADSSKIIDPDAGAGYDYLSLATWESWAQGQGTSGDTNTAQCRSSSGTADGGVTLGGWVEGVKFHLEALSGHQALKSGFSTSRYRIATTNANCITLNDATTGQRITGLQVSLTSDNTTNYRAIHANNASLTVTVKNVRVKLDASSKTSGALDGISAFEGIVTANNCIVTGSSSAGATSNLYSARRAINAYNCIGYGPATVGATSSFGDGLWKNCAIFNTTDDFNTISAADASYCASDDGDGTNAVTPSGGSWTNEFTDPANGNFTLLNTGNLYNAGIGPSSDANVPTTDIDGDARSGTTCDIGADEYVSTGTTYNLTAGSVILTGSSPTSIYSGGVTEVTLTDTSTRLTGIETVTDLKLAVESGIIKVSGASLLTDLFRPITSGAVIFNGSDLVVDATGPGATAISLSPGATQFLGSSPIQNYSLPILAGTINIEGQEFSVAIGSLNTVYDLFPGIIQLIGGEFITTISGLGKSAASRLHQGLYGSKYQHANFAAVFKRPVTPAVEKKEIADKIEELDQKIEQETSYLLQLVQYEQQLQREVLKAELLGKQLETWKEISTLNQKIQRQEELLAQLAWEQLVLEDEEIILMLFS